MTARDHQRREATSWAAATLTAKGCVLHPVDGGAWDVELPSGAWRAAEDWRELCAVAREVRAGAEASK